MTRAHSSYIPDEEVKSAVSYDFERIEHMSARFAAKLKAQEQAEAQARLSNAKESSFADGFAQGKAEGYTEGQAKGYADGYAKAKQEAQRQFDELAQKQTAESQEQARHFAQRFALAEAQIAESEQTIAQGILELACALARQVLRHELASNPTVLQPVLREALSLLIADTKVAVVRLHPLDLDGMQELAGREFPALQVSWVADPTVSRGGCLVESAGTVVDGTVEKRWSRAVASLGLNAAWEAADDTA